MRNTMSKTIIAGVAALALGASALATVEPAAAAGRAWHGGGGWAGPAIVGGLAAGALLAAPYAYGYGYNGCYAYQPMYDAYGNYIGQQAVRTC